MRMSLLRFPHGFTGLWGGGRFLGVPIALQGDSPMSGSMSLHRLLQVVTKLQGSVKIGRGFLRVVRGRFKMLRAP